MKSKDKLTAISLFASSGIGDLALRSAGAKVLVANELLKDRARLFRRNFPETLMLDGSIIDLSDEIIQHTKRLLDSQELDILFATPPCQGMSKNGRGKLLKGVRDGSRDQLDPRNQLATFVPPIVKELSPRIVIFENVPEMEYTLIENEKGELVDLLDHLGQALPNYRQVWKTIEFANYGVPQRRQRLITVFVRSDVFELSKIVSLDDIFPDATHSQKPTLFQSPWVTVLEAIGKLPKLDSKNVKSARSDLPLHYVPVLDEKKYWWVSKTRLGASAFDNQCDNPKCGFDGNPTHSTSKDTSGINKANRSTPIHCLNCGSLLPRPVVIDEHGNPRLMKGFTSAYKRMRGDLPASALTTNLSYVMSDQKIHPNQNRPLSLMEASILHTVSDFEWIWEVEPGKPASDKLIRESLGESIPPRGLEILFKGIFTKLLNFDPNN